MHSIQNHAAPPTAASPNASPPAPAESLVREALAEIAFAISEVTTLHQIDDDLDFVWMIMIRLDRIRVRLLRELKGVAPREDNERCPGRPLLIHPAVQEFLERSRAGIGE